MLIGIVMQRITINGLSIGYQQVGQGEPLVLLHGGVSDSRYWRNHMLVFAEVFNVIAWDAPGCGISDDPPENFSLANYADTLAEFLNNLEIVDPHVLGISFGGGLALALYDRYPQTPKSLILVSAYAGWAGSLPQEEVAERLQNGIKESFLDPESVIDSWIPSLFSSSATNDMKKEVGSIIKGFHPAGMRVMLAGFAKADLRAVLPKIHIPTCLLYGEEDVRAPLHVATDIHEQISSSQLTVIPGVGHLVDVEAPDLFRSLVKAFIAEQAN
jgi:pimeloyl-ACP methyl ester carboxylesterase